MRPAPVVGRTRRAAHFRVVTVVIARRGATCRSELLLEPAAAAAASSSSRARRRCRLSLCGSGLGSAVTHALTQRGFRLCAAVGRRRWPARSAPPSRRSFTGFAALIMLGGTGLVTCLTFAWFSAPDLALTQIFVEIVTMVLDPARPALAAASASRSTTDAARHPLDACVAGAISRIAVVAGTGMAALVLRGDDARTARHDREILHRKRLCEGGGRNVVNVILVDFRGFDTLGEITVLGIVALTVYALLRRFRPAPDSIDVPGAQRPAIRRATRLGQGGWRYVPSGIHVVPAVLARLLLPWRRWSRCTFSCVATTLPAVASWLAS